MQVFASARFAVISWLIVKAHLLLCSRWCWMEPGGVGESSKKRVNNSICGYNWRWNLTKFIPVGWFMCVFMVISTKSHWILRDQDLGRHGLKTNIDQCTDGWISSIIKTRYYLGRKPFPNVQLAVGGPLRFPRHHGMKRCMLDRKWYLFPKSVNVYCIWYNVECRHNEYSNVESTAT